MTLLDLFNNTSLIFNEYVVVTTNAQLGDDIERYIFIPGGGYTAEDELLDEVKQVCPHLLDHEIVSIFSGLKYYDEILDPYTELEICVCP